MSARDDKTRPGKAPIGGVGGTTPNEIDPDAPPTEDELVESARLRDALEDSSIPNDDADLARALASAYGPDAIAADALEELVSASLDPAEIAAAEALRDSLQDGSIPNDDAVFAHALASAWAPKDIDDAQHRAIVQKALAAAAPRRIPSVPRERTRIVRVAAAIVTGSLAVAASVLFVMQRPAAPNEAPLARARSTQPLFAEPFKPGEASARIDKIAIARASDYRDNRFAKWGVR